MINKLAESVTYYPGTFIDSTTFLDPSGNPYELKVSKIPPSDQQDDKSKTKIRINNKTGAREIYIPSLGKWRPL